jgi:chorismate mutase/prephenate dehydratase
VPTPEKPDLSRLRTQIDALDTSLIALLNQRAKLVVEIGQVKRDAGLPIYAPHREAQVLAKVQGLNQGPLPPSAIEGIYREIMSGSFALERGLAVGYLGPPGSFSHLAAAHHFGSSVTFEDLRSIDGVFTEVARGHVNYALAPIENSIHGGVVETLDALASFAGRVHIYAEAQLEVHQCLLANCDPAKVQRIYSKPEVFSQCKVWLATQYPNIPQIPAPSSSRAVQMVSEESDKDPAACSAAIGSVLAGELYDVNTLFENIEDASNNITRFFVLSQEETQPSGDDKTSIMFKTLDKPGALADVLAEFQREKVNLTHIDKRPAGRVNWTYTFFIDAQGHRKDQSVAAAVDRARTHCQELVVLGSYPRSKRIL